MEVPAIITGDTPGILADAPEALNHEPREPIRMTIPEHSIIIPV
jgi:hypothetical protein